MREGDQTHGLILQENGAISLNYKVFDISMYCIYTALKIPMDLNSSFPRKTGQYH